MYRTRNAAYVEAYRGFESPPLRHTLSFLKFQLAHRKPGSARIPARPPRRLGLARVSSFRAELRVAADPVTAVRSLSVLRA